MIFDAVIAYTHLLSIFFLAWFLGRQWLLLKNGARILDVETLARTDLGYFISAGAVLLTGLGRLFFGVKPVAFYTHNAAFHTLLALFVLVALLSIAPTINYQRWRRYRRDDASFEIPSGEWRWTRVLVSAEMIGLILIPFAAVLMARGIGSY